MPPAPPRQRERRDGMADSPALGQNVPNLNPEPSGLYLMDGIAGLRSLPEHSVDMLLTDPPYGTTRNYWDVPLPLPELWEAVRWAVKPSGAVLFFAQCPYDKILGASNLSMLRYEWVWYKSRCKFIAIPTGSNGLRTNLRFSIRNISENLASEVELYDIKVLKPNNEVFWTSDTNYKYLSLSSNEEIKIELKNPALQGDGYIFSLEMQCVDKFDKQHKYMIKGICEKIDTFPVFKITELI